MEDVAIVGAGPAGTAAALQIAALAPEVARRTLLLDAAPFPREKLCGGGVVREVDRLLAELGVTVDVPAVPIRHLRFHYAGGTATWQDVDLFRVVRRERFDAYLLNEVRARGIRVREGDPVLRARRDPDGIRIETKSGETLRVRTVIGADGARSVIRRELVGSVQSERFVALEVLTAGHDDAPADEPSEVAGFDFRPVHAGLVGYRWHFPSVRRGRWLMNRGVIGVSTPRGPDLASVLDEGVRDRTGVGLERTALLGAGAPLYHPRRPQGAERVVLAGDAVGIDPWFAEGISGAIGTGALAARTVLGGLSRNRFDFGDHRVELQRSPAGRILLQRRLVARRFYAAASKPGGLDAWLRPRAA